MSPCRIKRQGILCMSKAILRLGKETLVYGTSTVVARLLNFCLVPFYTYYLATAEYGVAATVFAIIALLNVVFLFGMDQSYLRFASEAENKKEVFQHCFYALLLYGAVLGGMMFLFSKPLSVLVGIGADHVNLIRLAVFILFLDMLNMIPFTKLRLQRRAWYFAGVRTASIIVNVLCNVLFIAVYKMGVESIFWANIFASFASLLLLSPVVWEELKSGPVSFNFSLQKQMLLFAWPFVPAGLASLLVSVIDKPILVKLVGLSEVGIYQANFKIGVFMMLIVSMFDQAWRPFFLSHAKDKDAKNLFAKVLTFFTAFASWVLLGLVFLMPTIIQSNIFGNFHLIAPQYWGGLNVIAPVLLGYFFYGLYINFMVGPVITKRTRVLMWITLLGAATSITVNLLLVPHVGIVGAGWAVALSYLVMAVSLFTFTQKVYPLPYEYKKLAIIGLLAAAIAYAVHNAGTVLNSLQLLEFKVGLLCAYPLLMWLIIRGRKNAKGN